MNQKTCARQAEAHMRTKKVMAARARKDSLTHANHKTLTKNDGDGHLLFLCSHRSMLTVADLSSYKHTWPQFA
eukprot:JP443262.1.p1 GENE.JP443262.1~~JP443262.1.p1  ORF type:complete len:73 (-),score=3.04 JP443262.1:20-238(-)